VVSFVLFGGAVSEAASWLGEEECGCEALIQERHPAHLTESTSMFLPFRVRPMSRRGMRP